MKKLVPILVIAVILGLGGYKYYSYKHPAPVSVQKEPDAVTASSPASSTSPAPKAVDKITVDVQRPVNGVLKGVIEVGASGFNSFVVNIDADKNWELVSKQFGKSLAYEGFASVEDVKTGLKKYMADIFEKGVSGRNVHFVMSSGALKNPKTELIAQAIEKMGYMVNRVTADAEGKFSLKAALPKNYRDNSYIVDMGSGNTKISWQDGGLHSLEASGAKYYEIPKTDAEVAKEIADVVAKVPANLKKNVFIIGGIPFELAKQTRSGDERFVQLAPPDDYSAGDNVKMRSGINIYRALSDASPDAHFIFDEDANFTIGFLLSLN